MNFTIGRTLQHEQRGQLTLFFDGHGDANSMEGSDGQSFTRDTPMSLIAQAAASNIQIIVVSNACLQGDYTLDVQQRANQHLAQRANRLPTNLAMSVRRTLEAADGLITFGRALTEPLQQLADIAEGSESMSAAVPVIDDLHLVLAIFDAFDHRLTTGFPLASNQLNRNLRAIYTQVRSINPRNRRQIRNLMRKLDIVSDLITEETAQINENVADSIALSDL